MDQASIEKVFSQLIIPQTDIDLLAFCASNRASRVKAWVDTLKAVQTVKTSGELYRAIPQVNRLKTSYLDRKMMLDRLMSVAYPCAEALGKEFLNQPIALPESAQKLALISQSMLNSLVIGYLSVIVGICREKKHKPQHLQAAAEAQINALQCLALMQLRNQQLYSQASKVVWRHANAVIATAKYLGLADTSAKPAYEVLQPMTVMQAYTRLVALATAKTNQLTQLDMQRLFKGLMNWSRAITIHSAQNANNDEAGFWVNTISDSPPISSNRQSIPTQIGVIAFDFAPLTEQLKSKLDGQNSIVAKDQAVAFSADIPLPTMMHLLTSWEQSSQRASQRRPATHQADMIIGFQQCHSKLSGHGDIASFLGQDHLASYTADTNTPMLDEPMTSLDLSATEKADSNNASDVSAICVTTKNVSRKGYCFSWQGTSHLRVDAGDITILREHGKRSWALGVIRWIRKLKQSTLFGVEVLSLNPQAVAVSCHLEKTGGFSDFTRGFVVPDSHSEERAALITSNRLFTSNTKIKLRRKDNDAIEQGSLGKNVLSTSKVNSYGLTISGQVAISQNQHML